MRGGLVGTTDDRRIVEAALFWIRKTGRALLALFFEEPLPFPWVQILELDAVKESRKARAVTHVNGGVAEAQLVGLALSGGGIRSATLNLGIVQALAELKLIPYLDYLSTISGGGYIGSWLHRWIRQVQAHGGNPETVRQALSPEESPDPDSSATRPIKWLRRYSNYLAPRLGLLQPADILSIATIWMRNALLNMIVIALALSAVLMVPRGMQVIFDIVHLHDRSQVWIVALPAAGFRHFRDPAKPALLRSSRHARGQRARFSSRSKNRSFIFWWHSL